MPDQRPVPASPYDGEALGFLTIRSNTLRPRTAMLTPAILDERTARAADRAS